MLDATSSLRRRAVIFRTVVVSRPERRLVLRMLAWRLVLPGLKRSMPIARLVSVMRAAPLSNAAADSLPPPERVAELARLVCRPRLLNSRDNCLDRSLIAYRYLIAAGADPFLALGLDRDNGTVIGHAWISIGGSPLGEPRAPLESFAEVISFGPEGPRAGT